MNSSRAHNLSLLIKKKCNFPPSRFLLPMFVPCTPYHFFPNLTPPLKKGNNYSPTSLMLQSQYHFDDARSNLSHMSAHCPASIHLVVPSNVHHTVIVNGCHTKPLLLPPFPFHRKVHLTIVPWFHTVSTSDEHRTRSRMVATSTPRQHPCHLRRGFTNADEPPQQTFKTSSRLPGVHPIPSACQVCFFHTSMIYHIVCTLVCLSEDHFCFNLEYTSFFS